MTVSGASTVTWSTEEEALGEVTVVSVRGAGVAVFGEGGGLSGLPGCRFEAGIGAEAEGGLQGTVSCQLSESARAAGVPFAAVVASVAEVPPAAVDQATLVGTGALTLPDGSSAQATVVVVVRAGGPGVGGIGLAVLEVFDGAPGDAEIGDARYGLPWQVVSEGELAIGVEATQSEPVGSPSPSPEAPESPQGPGPSPSPSAQGSSPVAKKQGSPEQVARAGAVAIDVSAVLTPSTDGRSSLDPRTPVWGSSDSARLLAILSKLGREGRPRLRDVLAAVGPFPIAGLAWWQDDWHAYRCCPEPHLHQGLDLFAEEGTPVVAAANGYVSQKLNGPVSGLAVEITDAKGIQYVYAHLSGFAPKIERGGRVRVGDVIGYVGNTGNARGTSSHLHFEIQPAGVPSPPLAIVNRWLTAADKRARALVERRIGKAKLPTGALREWSALAEALAADSTTEVVAVAPPEATRTVVPRVAPAVGGGTMDVPWLGAVAGALLLLLFLFPGAVPARARLARRPGWRPAGLRREPPAGAVGPLGC